MKSWLSPLLLALALAVNSAQAAETHDVVVLKDGRTVEGKIVREDESAIFMDVGGGEERGIAKVRIAEVKRAPKQAEPKAGPGVPEPNAAEMAHEDQKIYKDLEGLASPSKFVRKDAIELAKKLGLRAVPVLLGTLNPKNKVSVEMRIGALRALAELGPLDNQGAITVGWSAMKDPDFEVRREAIAAIHALKDDRSMEYMLKFAASDDAASRYAAARALRELNDDRAFAALASAIPAPQVTANVPDHPQAIQRMDLPVGPGGSKMPVFLPQGEVQGVAEGVGSPMAEALKIISGKDLGSNGSVWLNWLNEKVGAFTRKELAEVYKNHSILNKMGSPQATK